MAVSNADTLAATDQWLAKVGSLRPWEVSDANNAVRHYAPADLRRLMAMLAEHVGKCLREPLMASDVEIILSTAANVSGVFAGVKDARTMAHAVPGAPRAWTLVLSALDGVPYEALAALVETKASRPKRGVRLKSSDLVGLAGMTAHIVGAYVSNNPIKEDELPDIITDVTMALAKDLLQGPIQEPATELRPAVPIKKSVTPDYLISLEDGKKYKSLKRHLRTHYNMSPDDYRAKWGLPKDYPMVAPNYTASRSALAKSMGLGRGEQRARSRSKPATK